MANHGQDIFDMILKSMSGEALTDEHQQDNSLEVEPHYHDDTFVPPDIDENGILTKAAEAAEPEQVEQQPRESEPEGALEKALYRARMRRKQRDPRDADGDGRIFDGTPQERPASSKPKKPPKKQGRTPRQLAEDVAVDGGFTYQPFRGETPASGFSVSLFPDREHILSGVDQVDAETISQFLLDNMDIFEEYDDAHAGAWHDTASGKVYLDITRVINDREEAEKLAKQHGQLAIFDLENFETIETMTPEERAAWEKENKPKSNFWSMFSLGGSNED